MQDRALPVVRERDIAEGYGALGVGERPGIRPFGNVRDLVEERKRSLGANQRGLQAYDVLTDGLHGCVELRQIDHRDEQFTQRQGACLDVAHADEEHDG